MAVTPALLALVIEAAIGYPPLLWRAFGHPVTWMGAMIGTLERRFNRAASARARRAAGLAALATVVGVLVEVPVMLSVVRIVNRSKGWYERAAPVV